MWRKTQKLLATVVPLVLLLAYLAVAACMLNRWDAMVPVTLTPVWAWAGAGALVSLLCWIVCRGPALGAMLCLFLVTAVAFSEEARGIYREAVASVRERRATPAPPEGSVLRIASVRCSGKEEALREAVEAAPDLLLVQEAPDKMTLDAVADRLYGVERSVTTWGDLAILGRGETLSVLTDPQGKALHVRLKHPGGLVIDATNLDLPGCAPRLDMWKPPVWKELVSARVETRRIVRTLLGENPMNRERVARVVGGGFGTPPKDDVFRPLENNRMVDTGAASGQGWNNTHPSTYPFLRLDQIWVSPNLVPLKSTTRLNPDAKGRIVVSEVRMPAMRAKTP